MAVMELNLAELDAAIEQRQLGQTLEQQAEAWSADLYTFLTKAWPVLEPDTPFVDGWHIRSICDHLEAVSAGELRRLIINVPPATSKSTTVSVIWPVWDWLRKPNRAFITGSYHIDLSTAFAVKSRDLIRSSWFQSRWGHIVSMKVDENLKSSYRNDRRGRRYATSPGGGGTGQHAHIIIVDDPHNAKDAAGATPAALQPAIEWQDGTLSTRFADPKTGAEVVIMQRLHESDLSGHLLAKPGHGWTVLCLPEEYEPTHPDVTPERIVLPSGRVLRGDPRAVAGDLLCPNRIGPVEHDERVNDLGSFRASGQLQQRPTAIEGEILKRADWMFYPPEWLDDEGREYMPKFTHVIQSWDTAFKDKTSSDFVVGQVLGVRGADRYLLRVFRDRMNMTATKTAMREANAWSVERWPRAAHKILIEKSANGVDIIADLKRELPGIEPVTASVDKTQRAIAASPALESGNVWLPGWKSDEPAGYESRSPASSAQLVEEAAVFPKGSHDDSVDAFSQAMNWARGRAVRGSVSASPQVGRIQVGNIPMGGWQPSSRCAVIVPVLNRPQNAQPLVDSFKASGADATLTFIATFGDEDQVEACVSTGMKTWELGDSPGPGDYARKIQAGYNHTEEPLVLLAADDLIFHPGWLEAVERIADEYDVGVIGTNDRANPLVKRGLHSTHPVVRRCYIDTFGGVVGEPGKVYSEQYSHQWVDVELCQTAMARGCYQHAHDAVIEHRHPLFNRSVKSDATYKRGQADGLADRNLYESRKHLWEQEATRPAGRTVS